VSVDHEYRVSVVRFRNAAELYFVSTAQPPALILAFELMGVVLNHGILTKPLCLPIRCDNPNRQLPPVTPRLEKKQDMSGRE